jgi:hypothetical protein
MEARILRPIAEGAYQHASQKELNPWHGHSARYS